jgi:fructose-specific phosphotransferase system IIA component
MERISEYLQKEACLMELKATTKEEAIRELSGHMARVGLVNDEQLFIHDLLEREKLGSTGIGHKVAIPHAPTQSVDGFVIGFARSSAGVDFAAMDGDEVNLIFAMGTNPQELSLYLQMLSQLSRLLRNETFRNELIHTAKTPEDVINLFKKFEKEG